MKFCIWTGASWEDWSPASIDEGGIGGSETAAVMVSRSLAKLGHEVELYGQFAEGKEGAYDSINHIHFRRVLDPGQIKGDVFISSRDVNALLLMPEARATGIWVHDINLGFDANDRLDKYDAIMCLSKWSAKTMEAYYPHIRRNRIFITRNGLDLKRFAPELSTEVVLAKKSWNPKFVFSSSPDRGLDKLLDMWPKIREMAQGAELHVYYGFKTWKMMARGNAAAMSRVSWFEDRLKRVADSGVIFHGRVGQKELAQAHMEALLWLYPTDFKETSCITAMEAQAAASVPICTNLAALEETVGEYGVRIKPFNMEARYEIDFLAAVRDLFDNPAKRNALATAAREHAMKNLSWDGVAAQWVEHFEKVIETKERRGD